MTADFPEGQPTQTPDALRKPSQMPGAKATRRKVVGAAPEGTALTLPDLLGAIQRMREESRLIFRNDPGQGRPMQQTLDGLQQMLTSGAISHDEAQACLQRAKGTTRRHFRQDASGMAKLLRAMDKLEEDILRYLAGKK